MSILRRKKPPINKKVSSLAIVDYSKMKVPMVVIYDSPLDFPGKVIARVFEGATNQPTNVYCEYETAAKGMRDAEDAGFTAYFPRSILDPKNIVGTYIR